MTVCALFFGKSFPIMITDSLISSSIYDQSIDTPLRKIENIEGVKNKKFYPAGLANKIWKIEYPENKIIFMTYAGGVRDAEDFATTIKTFEYDMLIDIIETKPSELERFVNKNLAVILNYIDKQGKLSYWFKNADYWKNLDGLCISMGSGSKRLLNIILENIPNHLLLDSDTPDSLQQKILYSLNVLAKLTKESLQDNSAFLDDGCGGLYNIFHFSELYPDNLELDLSLCQIFLNKKDSEISIDKCIITYRNTNSAWVSIVSNPNLILDYKVDIIDLSLGSISSKYEINNLKNLSNTNSNIDEINKIGLHLIIYMYEDFKNEAGKGKRIIHNLHTSISTYPAITFKIEENILSISFPEPFINSIINRFINNDIK